MDGVISCDKFKYQWRNVSLLKGGDYDTVDDNIISNAADGEFEDDDEYVVADSNNDSDGDDATWRKKKKKTSRTTIDPLIMIPSLMIWILLMMMTQHGSRKHF